MCCPLLGNLFFFSDLFATVLRGPSAQTRPRPSPGPRCTRESEAVHRSPRRARQAWTRRPPACSGSESSVDAKALAAAKLRAADHRWTHACSYTRAAQQRWCGARAAARQKPNELSGVGVPPAAKLEGEDNEAAARGAEKLGVRSLFGKAGVPKGSPAESACGLFFCWPSFQAQVRHVRDWRCLIQAQRQPIQAWPARVHSQFCTAMGASRLANTSCRDDLLLELRVRSRKHNSRKQPSWWILQRSAAWRERNCNRTELFEQAFRAARNRFHRTVRQAKAGFWSSWLTALNA